jgi:hypothetical protein
MGMVDGLRYGQWSGMVNGQWSMVNGMGKAIALKD